MKIKGLASTGNKDSQDEYLDPSRFDLSDFKWLNYNHLGKDNPGAIIGEPTKAVVNSKNELHIEGILYPEMPMAQSTWALMKSLKNSPGGNKLSLSVEGKVVERGSKDPKNPLYKQIIRSKITGVAICPVPVNGDTWVDFQKSYNGEEDQLEVTKKKKDKKKEEKAFTAEGNIGTSVEDVEHAGQKRKITKSEVYESIFTHYENIDIEKAKSVYQLIEKISTMKNAELSQEVISKAFAILDLSKGEVVKKAEEEEEKENGGEEEKEEMKKAKAEKKMLKKSIKKASEMCSSMMKEGKEKGEMKKAMYESGFDKKVVKKAMKKSFKKADTVANIDMKVPAEAKPKAPKAEEMKKSDVIENILKSNQSEINTKFDALGDIFKYQNNTIASLEKSLSDVTSFNTELKNRLDKVETTPGERKSKAAVSYTERFQKSENGEVVYNIANSADRVKLGDVLQEMSGINKGGNFDAELMKGAQDLELSKSITGPVVKRLGAAGIKVINEA